MIWPALYAIGQASMVTLALVVIFMAQVERKQKEDTPINYSMLRILTVVTITMWAGVIAIIAITN